MPFYTYILQSQKSGKLYIGHTGNISVRVAQHNEGMTTSTRGKGPWEILHYAVFETREEAMVMEYKLKKWKSKIRVLEWIEREKLKNEH